MMAKQSSRFDAEDFKKRETYHGSMLFQASEALPPLTP
jgi:hypothetical protein